MAEVDSLVHAYLLTFSPKLAKQFAKKKPLTVPWSGPDLLKLIQLYKDSCPKEPAVTVAETNGDKENAAPPAENAQKKKGKKRKLEERDEEDAAAVVVLDTAKKDKKKKKKKGKKSVPDVVEVIQDSEPAVTEPAVTEPTEPTTPAEQTTPAEPTDVSPGDSPVVGGLVGNPPEEEEEEEEGVEEEQKPKKKLKRKGPNGSFRRVKEEDIVIKKAELTDNTFEAKGGADGYGYKANQILKFTKGKSFRHEKTKKKRGTYKGGEINMGVTSIKFDSDSE